MGLDVCEQVSNCKVNGTNQLVLLTHLKPLLHVGGWLALEKLGYLELLEILLFHDYVVLGCFRRLSKVIAIHSFCIHLPIELFGLYRSYLVNIDIALSKLWHSLDLGRTPALPIEDSELLTSLYLADSLEESQSLLKLEPN